jgi:hypothetical protein
MMYLSSQLVWEGQKNTTVLELTLINTYTYESLSILTCTERYPVRIAEEDWYFDWDLKILFEKMNAW